MRFKKTKKEALHEIVEKYRKDGEKWPTTTREIAAWACRQHLYEPERKSVIDQLTLEISHAMREEYFTDKQGRRVRKKHAIREIQDIGDGKHKQLTFWVDIEDAEPKEMQAAFQQRRMQVLGDCRQLKTDVDSYNDNNKYNDSIQMYFDFTEDLIELEKPVEYAGLED